MILDQVPDLYKLTVKVSCVPRPQLAPGTTQQGLNSAVYTKQTITGIKDDADRVREELLLLLHLLEISD